MLVTLFARRYKTRSGTWGTAFYKDAQALELVFCDPYRAIRKNCTVIKNCFRYNVVVL